MVHIVLPILVNTNPRFLLNNLVTLVNDILQAHGTVRRIHPSLDLQILGSLNQENISRVEVNPEVVEVNPEVAPKPQSYLCLS